MFSNRIIYKFPELLYRYTTLSCRLMLYLIIFERIICYCLSVDGIITNCSEAPEVYCSSIDSLGSCKIIIKATKPLEVNIRNAYIVVIGQYFFKCCSIDFFCSFFYTCIHILLKQHLNTLHICCYRSLLSCYDLYLCCGHFSHNRNTPLGRTSAFR